jgi:hypothetical protein
LYRILTVFIAYRYVFHCILREGRIVRNTGEYGVITRNQVICIVTLQNTRSKYDGNTLKYIRIQWLRNTF